MFAIGRFLTPAVEKKLPGHVTVVYTVLYPETGKIICMPQFIFAKNRLPKKIPLKPALTLSSRIYSTKVWYFLPLFR